MRDFNTKVDDDPTSAGEVVAAEYNSLFGEIKNMVKSFFTLDEADSRQLVKASDAFSKANSYSDVGGVNTVVLTRLASIGAVETLFDGMVVMFKPANVNTGATTVKLNALAAKPLFFAGADIAAGFLRVGVVYSATYDLANDRFDCEVVSFGNLGDDVLFKDNGNIIDLDGNVLGGLEGRGKNVLINGGFKVNQRGVSGSVVLMIGQYGHDRFRAGAAGCSYTFTEVAGTTEITISAGSLIQVVESVNLITGNYTLSWEGSAQGKIGAGAYSNSGLAEAVVGGANLNVEFDTGTLSKVKLELGDVATGFEDAGFGEELERCHRYYEKSYAIDVFAGAVTDINAIAGDASGVSDVNVDFKVEKRGLPTVIFYSPSGAINMIGYRNTIGYPLNDVVVVNSIIGTSRMTVESSPGDLMMPLIHFTADAEI